MPPFQSKRQMSMYVYQAIYAGDPNDKRTHKYVSFTKRKFPYVQLKVGAIFTAEKRPADYHLLKKQKEYAVEAIRFSLSDGSCIVIIERRIVPKDQAKTKKEKAAFKGAQVFPSGESEIEPAA